MFLTRKTGDPLIDTDQCTRDAKLMQKLGANTIRVYHVDHEADHEGCMSAFSDAGIYALIDLDSFATYILPVRRLSFFGIGLVLQGLAPASVRTLFCPIACSTVLTRELQNDPWWNETQYHAYADVMDSFSKFDNTLGFFVGNEIIALNNQSHAAPFIKAAARDMKAYRDSKGYRKFPIGYSATDIAELRPMLQEYLTCGGNASENIDFFSLNSYEWCDPSTYESSGYETLESMAADFPVPIFFSETGCNVPGPRIFDDQATIFGPKMVKDWSGSIVYEWIQEANNYGLISYGSKVDPTVTGKDIHDGFTRKGTPTPVSPDFSNLKSQWASITPTGVSKSAYDPDSVSTRDCPAATKGGWLVDKNVPLPTLGETYSGAPAPTGGAASPSSTNNPAPVNKEITGMAAGLVSVMVVFTFWL